MPQTLYQFSHAVSAFFEMPTEAARALLPSHLQPLEVQHGSGIFAVTAFDFTGSMVGNYQEIVLAVIVPPLAKPGEAFPRSAFFPFRLGVSTPESRAHAMERWHLPHYMSDIQLDFEEAENHVICRCHEGGTPIMDLTVRRHQWSRVDHLYQSFMVDGPTGLKVDIHMEGEFSEHEEELGKIVIHDHPMCQGLDPDEVSEVPFRELWMRNGVQTFEELETLAPA
jgi:hypothetical protein